MNSHDSTFWIKVVNEYSNSFMGNNTCGGLGFIKDDD